jgi:dTDP-4-amino-4,6-dideoxygalactose transaminase
LVPDGYAHSFQAYVCYVEENRAPKTRNEIMELLQTEGVSTRPGTHAVHLLGYYRERFGLRPEDYPGARDCDAHTIALPLHNRMSADDYHHVAKCLRQVS